MNFIITNEEKEALLATARESIAAKLENRLPQCRLKPSLKKAVKEGSSILAKPNGAFVTLHTRVNRKLRGCIGRMSSDTPLEETVRNMALEAAFGDPRFPALEAGELNRIGIEISVLSPMESCADPRSVKIGKHGILLRHWGRGGVFLPQVPVEQGWNLDEYLDHICIKAGLPPGSYNAPGAEFYTFTAVVFGEDD